MSKNGSCGQKFDMVSTWLAKSSTFLLAPEHSLHVAACKLANSADRKRDEQLMSERRAKATRWHSARQNLRNGRSKIRHGFGKI
jgi:hypothetical protein